MAFSQGDEAEAKGQAEETAKAKAEAREKKINFNEDEWLTDGIRELLAAIRGEHAGKKRRTVIKLAFARANGIPLKRVFDQEDTCAEVIWYTKWLKKPAIKAAYDACLERALAWVDEHTAELETSYRQSRRRAMARYAAQAPKALAEVMNDPEKGGGVRIEAANALLTWIQAAEVNGTAGQGRPKDAKDLSDDELAAIAAAGGR